MRVRDYILLKCSYFSWFFTGLFKSNKIFNQDSFSASYYFTINYAIFLQGITEFNF